MPVAVLVGMDLHKRSATIEVVDECGQTMAQGRYCTDNAGYAEMLHARRRFPQRVWAVEGCNGIGRHLAHRLVHDGEVVVDVPATLSAQVRVFATGNGTVQRTVFPAGLLAERLLSASSRSRQRGTGVAEHGSVDDVGEVAFETPNTLV
jgi:hypothetical protein